MNKVFIYPCNRVFYWRLHSFPC